MKISSNLTKFNHNIISYSQKSNRPIVQYHYQSNEGNKFYAYKDYNISFGARLNRTPEDFYSQPFNIENMPITVKDYLYEDFDEHHHMPPAQLQRNAYKYIKIADNVEDVKSMYPNEPLFEKLRPFSDTKATRGTLFLLRWDLLTSQTPIFKDKDEKDLTVYFLKKVYLEGKTLKEINEDFEKDSTDAIKKELGIKDGKYFTHVDLNSLGIRYPNLSYYNSFLATRQDKEYIPIKKTVEYSHLIETKEEPIPEQQDRVVSEETREKLRDAKRRWWANLSLEDREEQIQKMMEGKELSNSVYARYQGPIMTIAAAKIGFSDRLISIIEEKFSDADFKDENDTFSKRQREIMLEFWNKDENFRKVYSDALKTTIEDFENAYNAKSNSTHKIQKLINKALELKRKILEKAKERQKSREKDKIKSAEPKSVSSSNTAQQSSETTNVFDINCDKDVIRAYKHIENQALSIYPDLFKDEMLKYAMKNTTIEQKRLSVAFHMGQAKTLFGLSDEEFEEYKTKLVDNIEKANDEFNKKNGLLATTNDFILCKFLYELTNEPIVFKFERGDVYDYAKKSDSLNSFVKAKSRFNKEMKKLCVPLSTAEVNDFIDNTLIGYVSNIDNNKITAYPELFGRVDIAGYLKKSVFLLNYDSSFRRETVEFFRKFNANIKYLKSHKEEKDVYDVILQNMLVEYMMFAINKFPPK